MCIWLNKLITWSKCAVSFLCFRPAFQMTNRAANHSAVRKAVRKSGGSMWKGIRLMVLLAVLAAVLYYVYCCMIKKEENPFGVQWYYLLFFFKDISSPLMFKWSFLGFSLFYFCFCCYFLILIHRLTTVEPRMQKNTFHAPLKLVIFYIS